MENIFSAIQNIAEERIRQAQEEGAFDDLPGRGRPLPERDDSGVPEELRMAYNDLSNATCLPPEVEERRQISSLADMLEKESDERVRVEQMRRLEALVLRQRLRGGRSLALHAADDAYLDKILDRARSRAGRNGRADRAGQERS